MPDRIVVNSSPLIVLARAGRIDLLTLIGTPIHVPETVSSEVRAHSDEAARALDTVAWLQTVPDAEMLPLVALLARQKGLVSLARPLVEELLQAGLYLSKPVIERALQLVGE